MPLLSNSEGIVPDKELYDAQSFEKFFKLPNATPGIVPVSSFSLKYNDCKDGNKTKDDDLVQTERKRNSERLEDYFCKRQALVLKLSTIFPVCGLKTLSRNSSER